MSDDPTLHLATGQVSTTENFADSSVGQPLEIMGFSDRIEPHLRRGLNGTSSIMLNHALRERDREIRELKAERKKLHDELLDAQIDLGVARDRLSGDRPWGLIKALITLASVAVGGIGIELYKADGPHVGFGVILMSAGGILVLVGEGWNIFRGYRK